MILRAILSVFICEFNKTHFYIIMYIFLFSILLKMALAMPISLFLYHTKDTIWAKLKKSRIFFYFKDNFLVLSLSKLWYRGGAKLLVV